MNLQEGPIKKIIRALRLIAPAVDILFLPFTLLAAGWFRIVRFWGLRKMPATKNVFLKLGVFPVVNHYYEPLFDYRQVGKRVRKETLNFNDAHQLDFLARLTFDDEIAEALTNQSGDWRYVFNNGSFEDKDARVYYSLIRNNKPSRILEVGSGFSTLIALAAITKSKTEDQAYQCEMTCIEPYEMPSLEKLNVKLIRQKVENVDPAIFSTLGEGDILFIDSSHIIRPGGDVTYLLLSVLPTLAKGVWIHVHDIFLPEDYPSHWLKEDFRMWNEQYLLEALLLGNSDFEIVLSLNYLSLRHNDHLQKAFPGGTGHKPGSFWIRKK